MPEHLSHTSADQPALIEAIKALLSQVAGRLEAAGGESKQWMLDNSPNPAVAEILQDTTLISIRVLAAVERLGPVNGITISKQFGIPKGSVSKITRRLIARKLIKKGARPNNKKEVLFRVTPLGTELLQVNRAFDLQMARGLARLLQRYDEAELRLIVRVLQDVLDTSLLNLGRPGAPQAKTVKPSQ